MGARNFTGRGEVALKLTGFCLALGLVLQYALGLLTQRSLAFRFGWDLLLGRG